MKHMEIEGKTGHSIIYVGEGMSPLDHHLAGRRTVIITDTTVRRLYEDRFPPAEVIAIGTGEGVKTLDTVREIYNRLIEMEADRSTVILGIGGGVVCDIAGFAASTYLRGVRFGFAPTTLLAQVDASVGGKNGVNVSGYKNMAGVFRQPDFVVCDVSLLKTLPDREVRSGFAEIIKHAAIADRELFVYLETRLPEALALVPDVIGRLVHESVAIKSAIVNRDETETGERRKLNFGHTFGHAVEKVSGMAHGEAVGIGMVIAAMLSQRRKILSRADARRLEDLIGKTGLPTRLAADGKKALDALKRDKKREEDRIHFVLLTDMGHAVVTPIPITELEEVIHDLSAE